MIAVSRRSTNVFPDMEVSNLRRASSPSTGGGSSGMAGGCIRAIGDSPISPSSTAHRKNCCTAGSLRPHPSSTRRSEAS